MQSSQRRIDFGVGGACRANSGEALKRLAFQLTGLLSATGGRQHLERTQRQTAISFPLRQVRHVVQQDERSRFMVVVHARRSMNSNPMVREREVGNLGLGLRHVTLHAVVSTRAGRAFLLRDSAAHLRMARETLVAMDLVSLLCGDGPMWMMAGGARQRLCRKVTPALAQLFQMPDDAHFVG